MLYFLLPYSPTAEVPGENKIHSFKKVHISGMFLFYYSNRHFLTYTLSFLYLAKLLMASRKVSACISKHVETAHWESYLAIIAMEDSWKPSNLKCLVFKWGSWHFGNWLMIIDFKGGSTETTVRKVCLCGSLSACRVVCLGLVFFSQKNHILDPAIG